MKAVLFYHSLISDWNHGNAHFLRGIVTELQERDVKVEVYEPESSWSMKNLIKTEGEQPLEDFYKIFPNLKSNRYKFSDLNLETILQDADMVIVHEWNDPIVVKEIGKVKQNGGRFALFFHDTHHRSHSAEDDLSNYDLSNYDGVLAYGQIIKEIYIDKGWHDKVWVWHEAADTNIFKPLRTGDYDGDLVWIGNWGDEERTNELYDYFISPVMDLNLRGVMYGVRYPDEAKDKLIEAGIAYKGWLANFLVPEVFAAFKATVHIPRKPYTEALPGIPTIRPFEAMACGIPLISAPWEDTENLFTEGQDYLLAKDEKEMKEHINAVINDPDLANRLSHNGRQTIMDRHTCSHRADELLDIYKEVIKVEENT